MGNDNCIFCRIVRGEIPCDRVYENDHVLAFRDVNPQAPVHVLIIPKKHYEVLTDIPAGEGLYEEIVSAACEVARLEGVSDRGFRLVNNCRAEGGQVVFHVHFHFLAGRQMSVRLG